MFSRIFLRICMTSVIFKFFASDPLKRIHYDVLTIMLQLYVSELFV